MARVQMRVSRGCSACTCSSPKPSDQSATPRNLTVVNLADAEVGQLVRIVAPPQASIVAPAVLFGIPFLGMLSGALAAYGIAPFPSEDLNALTGASLGLLTGSMAARIIATCVFADTKYLPQAVEILPVPADSHP